MTDTLTRPKTDLERETKILPPYHVIFINDEFHSMGYVTGVIEKIFGYSAEKAAKLMLKVHEEGRAIIWTGSKEVAELKQEQVQTDHEYRNSKDLGPIGVELEPAM